MPTDSKRSTVFRESFLALFERPEHEAALRLIGSVLTSLVWEGKGLLDAPAATPRSSRLRDARSAVGDLQQAVDMLSEIGQQVDDGFKRETTRLMLAIADAADEVKPIADRLDAAFTRFLAAPEEG